ncbi:MAG: ferredoxin family protein [Planctomycetota bacterium]
MAGKIIIDKERCKGCTLCVAVCPHNVITLSDKANSKGYFPAEATGPNCTGCANCAIVCPDAAIEVYRDGVVSNVKSINPARLGIGDEKAKKGFDTLNSSSTIKRIDMPSRSRAKKNEINNLVRKSK